MTFTTTPLAGFTDQQIAHMRKRAFHSASREYAELRQWCDNHGGHRHSEVCHMLAASAHSANEAWQRLTDEMNQRLATPLCGECGQRHQGECAA